MEDSLENTKKTYLLRTPTGSIPNPVLPTPQSLSLPKGPKLIIHDYTHLFANHDPEKQKWIIVWCKDADCGQCHNPEAFRIAQQLTDFVDNNPSPNWFFLTLSTPNRMDLGQAYAELLDAFSAMIRQASVFPSHHWNLIDHWIGVTEIKMGKNGFNVHRHIIAGTDTFRLPYNQCHEEWNQASQCKAAHYNLKKIHHPLQNNIRYLSKYMTKDVGWGGLDSRATAATKDFLRGKRRITRSRNATWVSKNIRDVKDDWKFCCVTPLNGCVNPDIGL